jgi:hypothetical protein
MTLRGNGETGSRTRTAIVPALASVALLGAVEASADIAVNCRSNPGALQTALAAAPPGETLRVEGTCRGVYTIDKNLTLSGKADATLDGSGQGPVLRIVAGVRVVVDSLVITGGASAAPVAVGGIANAGHLEVRRSKVIGNTAVGEIRATGGIDSRPAATAHLTVDRSEVADNRALAVANPTGTLIVSGGIANEGPVTISRSEIRGNTSHAASARFHRAFGGVLFGAGTSRMERTVIRENIARSEHTGTTGTGLVAGAIGGFAHLLGTELVVDNSVIQANRAFAVSAVGSGSAGAIASGGTVTQVTTLIRTDVIDNVAESGTFAVGGIDNNSTTFVLERSTFSGNTASAMFPSGVAVGAIATGFFGPAHTSLERSSVTANVALGSTATGGLHKVGTNGLYELDRTDVTGNSPNDCNFACQP